MLPNQMATFVFPFNGEYNNYKIMNDKTRLYVTNEMYNIFMNQYSNWRNRHPACDNREMFVYKFHPNYREFVNPNNYKLFLQQAFRRDINDFTDFKFAGDSLNLIVGDARDTVVIFIYANAFHSFISGKPLLFTHVPVNNTVPETVLKILEDGLSRNSNTAAQESNQSLQELSKNITPIDANINKPFDEPVINITETPTPDIASMDKQEEEVQETTTVTEEPETNESSIGVEVIPEVLDNTKYETKSDTSENVSNNHELNMHDYSENTIVSQLGYPLLKGNIGSISIFIKDCVSTPTHINPKTCVVDMNIVYVIYFQWYITLYENKRSNACLPDCMNKDTFLVDFVVLCKKLDIFPHFLQLKNRKGIDMRHLIAGICVKNPFLKILYPRTTTQISEDDYDEQKENIISRYKRQKITNT